MVEKDYVLRMIKELIRAIIKLIFHVDTQAPTAEILSTSESQQTTTLLISLVDEGKICEAENMLFEIADWENKDNIGIALLFYSYLNDQSDEFLVKHNFSREEIRLGLQTIVSKCGISCFSELFS